MEIICWSRDITYLKRKIHLELSSKKNHGTVASAPSALDKPQKVTAKSGTNDRSPNPSANPCDQQEVSIESRAEQKPSSGMDRIRRLARQIDSSVP